MEAPKFKFGDTVKERGSYPFRVGIIIDSGAGYLYGDEMHKPYHSESKLELVKPKKTITLYRHTYKTTSGVIYQGAWTEEKYVGPEVLHTEEKTLEIEE